MGANTAISDSIVLGRLVPEGTTGPLPAMMRTFVIARSCAESAIDSHGQEAEYYQGTFHGYEVYLKTMSARQRRFRSRQAALAWSIAIGSA